MIKPTNAIVINNKDSIYETWLNVLKPIHSFTDKELKAASLFLDSYFQYKESIVNDELLNSMTFSIENKRKIRNTLGISPVYFQLIMRQLKEKKFIVENKINSNYVPTLNEKGDIVLTFIIKDEKNS